MFVPISDREAVSRFPLFHAHNYDDEWTPTVYSSCSVAYHNSLYYLSAAKQARR